MQFYNPEQALLKARREFGEHGGVAPSISRSSTFTVMEPDFMPELFEGVRTHEQGCFLYSRHFNPTVDVLSRYMAALEGTETAVCTGSGMAAISCTLLQLCKNGDHIVSSDAIYGGTHALMCDLLPEMGVKTTFVDISDLEAVKNAITDNTRLVYTEALGNPILKVADIPMLSQVAHGCGVKLVVDNTFSPLMITPSVLGADVVIYSMTKYINGASDLIAGVVCGSSDFINSQMDIKKGRIMLLGPTMDPRVAFDLIQRIPHLPIRMKEHSKRAMAMADLLQKLGVSVIYPGLKTHPGHELMKSQLNRKYGFGGILAIDCGTREKAFELMSILQNEVHFGLIAVSLGYFDTLISCSGSSTSSEIPEETQKKMGLSPGLLRISIGYTGSLENRLEQMEGAVKKTGLVSR